jgi:hypothetical protein
MSDAEDCIACWRSAADRRVKVRDTFGGRKELRRVRECVSGKHREILPKSGGS